MNKFYKTVLRVLALTFFCTLILACSKLTQNNFEKIQTNMTMKEVIAIIGEPTSSESINIAGISGTSAVWKNKDAEIDIQFLNDRVAVKAFSNSVDESETPQERKKK